MTLNVEDGSGLAVANSYASVDQYKAFARARGVVPPATSGECEVLLTKGWDAMLGLEYKGYRATRDQRGDFPRIGVCIDGFGYASSEIPPDVPDLQCAFALAAQSGVLLQPTIGANQSGPIIQETVGPISTTYADGGRSNTRPIIEQAQVYLRRLLKNVGGARIVRA